MNNVGWGYLILFGVLTSPFIFWACHRIAKTLEKDIYKDEFDEEQEKMDYWCAL